MSPEDSIERLQAENAELRARLEESEETLRAIRSGEVDALVVEGSAGPQVFILQTADADSNRFRSDILAKVSDAIVAIDDDQRVLYLNAAAERQYGVTSSGTLGRALTDLYENRWIRPGDEELFTKALRETGSWRGEHIHIKRDGKAIHVESAVSRLIAADGAPSGQLSVIRDVTERKQVERALAAQTAALLTADRSKDEFLAMLAHELRNPLAPLRNAAELLQARDATGEEREEAQRIICRQIENMSRMLDDLLDVSRITEGKIDLRKQPVALEAVLNAATNLVQAQSIANGQELKVSLSEEPIYLNADATRLEQIFGNLLTNSCKYSGKGSRISLSAERAEGVEPPEVIVRVRDDGAGIDVELVPRIFDLFVQATRALDRAHGGLGIGLTLVQRLVHLHGGRVEAHSDGPGCGAEFTVHLPILREA
ncbi:MAG TPA: ATP-binding protein, partial [Candidatus Saccharimonadia bacterium]|nr:ATP-binding protein [Candidatus Saccharimonadia bacterium]